MTDQPLATLILEYLHEHPGVVGAKEIDELRRKHDFTLMQLNDALRELKAQKIDTCLSCRSFISSTTEHAGDCPHGD